MISIGSEEILTFSQTTERLPRARSGRAVHPNTIWRWAMRGLKARSGRIVKLEVAKIGGRNCTSKEALDRFFAALQDSHVAPQPSRKRVEEELNRIGI